MKLKMLAHFHVSWSSYWNDPQALSSAHCTSPSELCQFICLSTEQAPDQVVCSAPILLRVDGHAVLHSPSQVNCQTKPPVAPTPWQFSSKDDQSTAMRAPGHLKYRAAELRSLPHPHTLNRSARKSLLKYNIWQPRSRSVDISPMKAPANIIIELLNARCVCNKTLLIKYLIVDKDLDVLALTKILTPSNCTIAEFLPLGYEIIHKHHQAERGGWVAVKARTELRRKLKSHLH